MKTILSAVAAICLASAASAAEPAANPAAAAKPASAQNPFKTVDAAIVELGRLNEATTRCLSTVDALKADLAAKQEELKAEFKGQVPQPFNELLDIKRARINTQRGRCAAIHKSFGDGCQNAHDALRSVQPQSLSGLDERAKKIGTYRARHNQLNAKFLGR